MPHVGQAYSEFALRENGLWLSDVTTNNATATKHGLCPKIGNSLTVVSGILDASDNTRHTWSILPIGNGADSIPTGLWSLAVWLPPGTITEVGLYGHEGSGSINMELWAKAPASWPPGIGDKITASAPATITTAQFNDAVDISTWTTSTGANGKWCYANVVSVTNFTLVHLKIKVLRS